MTSTNSTPRLTKTTFRAIFGATLDLTNEDVRRAVYGVFSAHAQATGAHAGRRAGDVAGSIPLPPASWFAAKLRALPEA